MTQAEADTSSIRCYIAGATGYEIVVPNALPLSAEKYTSPTCAAAWWAQLLQPISGSRFAVLDGSVAIIEVPIGMVRQDTALQIRRV